jgi:GTP-binding protein
MFVDEVDIQVHAGDGGNGCMAFRREMRVPRGGPSGGDGGVGGSIYLVATLHQNTLVTYRFHPEFKAERGQHGQGSNCTGYNGADLILEVPPGTVVYDSTAGDLIQMADLATVGDRVLIARGGRGGRGNARFATPTHQAPRRADPGEEGEERTVELELKLIADVGLVGLPNAGKSTLLSRITRARPKVADYPFTTLEPNLGIVSLEGERTFVVADLPGLIEGANAGKGLGLQFLRHVERTRLLVFLLDVTAEDPAGTLALLEREIAGYSATLAEKPRRVVLSKADLLPPDEHSSAPARLGLPEARLISAHSGEGVRGLLEDLWTMIPPGADAGLAEAGENDGG